MNPVTKWRIAKAWLTLCKFALFIITLAVFAVIIAVMPVAGCAVVVFILLVLVTVWAIDQV